MKALPDKKTINFFLNFVVIYFIYTALAGIGFEKQGVVTIVFPALCFLFLVRTTISRVEIKTFMTPVFGYLLFLLILFFFVTSEYVHSLKGVMKVSMTFMMFPISFQIIRTPELLNVFYKKLILLMILYLINFFTMNLLGISFKGYGNDISTGNIFTEGLHAMAYCLILIPLIALTYERKKLLFFIAIAVFITLLLTMKRTSIVGVVFGYAIFLFSLKRKIKFLKGLIVAVLIGLLSYPLYSDKLQKQIDNRGEQLEVKHLEDEARYAETVIIFSDIFSFKDPAYSFFGKEIFNSSGTYGGGDLYWGNRQLHSDYSLLLHGSGIIGLLWYFLVQIIILKVYFSFRRKVYAICGYTKQLDYINATFLSFFYLSFFLSLSGGVDGIIYNCVRYMFLGAIIGHFYTIVKTNKNIFKSL
jgi:hypothetical protein